MRRQRGFSLIEFMISMVLSSLILAFALQHYQMTKQQYLHIHSLLEQSFELQLLNDLLRDRVRKAGFTPCRNINSLETFDRRSGKTKLVAIATPPGRSDALLINRMSEHFTTVLKAINTKQLLLPSTEPLKAGQPVLIADCYHAEIQPILHLKKTNAGLIVSFSHHLAFDYIEPIYLGEWIEETFFMRSNRQGKPALYYHQKHTEELSNLIRTMSIQLQNYRNNLLVAMTLELEKAKTMQINTKVRSG